MQKNLNKIIELGLYLFAFLLPIQTRLFIAKANLGGYHYEPGTISLYLTDILLVVLLLLYFCNLYFKNKNREKRDNKFNIFWILIAGLEVVIVIGIFLSHDKLLAFYGYVRFLLGISLFWIILKAQFSKEKLILTFIFSAFLQALFGIWQFLIQSTPVNKWLGLAGHSGSDLGASVIEIFNGERWLRAYGSLDHPNMLGGMLVVALFFTSYSLLKYNLSKNRKMEFSSSRIVTKIKTEANKINIPDSSLKNIIFLILISVFSASIFFTFSRAAAIGLIAGFAMLLFLTIIKRDLNKQKRVLEIILITGCVFFVFYNVYSNLVNTRLASQGRLETKSVNERVESVKIASKIFQNHKFFGTGLNNYGFAVDKEIENTNQYFEYQPVHNTYLLVLAETGFLGLFFFLGFLYYFLIYFLKEARKSNDCYLRLPIYILILTMFMFDHWWWSLHFGVLFFWFLLGILVRNTRA